MKYCIRFALFIYTAAMLSSCIKDEKANIEADIIEVLSEQEGILNIVYQNNAIDIYADAGRLDETNLTLSYVLSDGATISPNPSDVTDYTDAQTFVVTSQDKQWVKTYVVRVLFHALPTKYDFENWMQPEGEKYKIPYEATEEDVALYIWSCGNEPYAFITNKYDDYTSFPTQPSENAYSGSLAAKLETKLTGDYYKPIAAGNLFIGQFDASKYDPLESTQFGLPFTSKPLRFKGMYKYRSGGETYHTKVEDRCKMQAVLYKTTPDCTHLNGYTLKDSKNIVARAEMIDGAGDTPGDGYVAFDLEFVYTAEIDYELLKNGGYNLAVIFSASRNGDIYDGAPGSVLYVDEVEIVCETNK